MPEQVEQTFEVTVTETVAEDTPSIDELVIEEAISKAWPGLDTVKAERQ